MKRTEPVAPFVRAAHDAVDPGPWTLSGGGEIAERVDHWDPLLNLHLERELVVDVDRLLASTGVQDVSSMGVAGMWRAERTRMRGPGSLVPLGQAGGEATVNLILDVPGTLAGGRLELQTVLMLTADVPSTSPIAARRSGSVLWSDRRDVRLEGDAGRFPMEVVDFASLTGIANDAPWALLWSPTALDQPILGEMRVLVNRHNAVAVAAVDEKVMSAESQIVASMIRFDVTRSLVFGALGNPDFLDRVGDFESDTVGRLLADLLDRFWPGIDPATLTGRLQSTPYRLEADLQKAMRLLT